MAKCAYKHCNNEAAKDSTYCRVHQGGDANRRGAGHVPDASSKVNQEGNEHYTKIKGWCVTAKREVETFLASDKFDDWASLFFAGQNVDTCKKIFSKMPDVIQAWHDGTKNITLMPVYDKTSTPNAVNTGSGNLLVSPDFFNGTDQVWVLVHESSHGVYSLDNKTKPVVDIRYQSAGAAFHELSPTDRLINADHYRFCVYQFSQSTLDASGDFGTRDEDTTGTGTVSASRAVTADKGYAKWVKSGALDVLQLTWLELFSLTTLAPDYFHDDGKMPSWYKDRSKPMLKGKSSSELKNKDFVRFEDLYGKSCAWITFVNQADCRDVYNSKVKGLETITLEKEDDDRRLNVKSYFKDGMTVDDKALRRGVKLLLEIVLRECPYNKVSVKDVLKMAMNAQKSRRQGGRDWILGF